MTDETMPPFQPSPLGLAPVTPETARRPGRKAKVKKEKKPRKVREPKLSLVTDADIAAAAKPEKKPRKKRKAKITTPSPGILDFMRLDKIANELAQLCGKDRADVLKLLAKLFK